MAIRTRTTRRRDTPPPLRTAIGGTLVVLALLLAGWLVLRIYNGVPGRDYATYYVSAPEVGNLLSHDQVRIAGARVGQVQGREVGPDGKPRIELQIEPGTELPADTKVAIRGAGLLGARYVELIPGRAKEELRLGTTIRGGESAYTFGLPETLDTFDAETRGRLGDMLGGLGQGMLGHGARLNDGLRAAGAAAGEFGAVAREILRRDGAAGRLIPALESAARPLDASRAQIARLTGVSADALRPFVDRREAVRDTLDEAPPALAAIQPGLGAGTGLLRSLDALAVAANRTLPGAPAGLRSLARLLDESEVPLRRASRLLDAVRPAVPGALRITDAVRPLLTPLRRALNHLSPVLGHTARYSCDVINFGVIMRSMTGFRQPGSGPLGPAMAFRTQAYTGVSPYVVNVKDRVGANKRDAVTAPCKYLSKPYPQFVPRARR